MRMDRRLIFVPVTRALSIPGGEPRLDLVSGGNGGRIE